MSSNLSLTGVERFFDEDEIIVSKTDLKGKLTYVNRTFLQLSSMTEKQCIGMPHNIIRNPEMPKCVFKLLWDTLQSGEEIFAYVNNRAANGDNYWVYAHVTPSMDQNNNIVGYHSNRRVPDRQILNEQIIPLYKDLLEAEKAASSSTEGMNTSFAIIENLLKEKEMTFNQFMFSLGG